MKIKKLALLSLVGMAGCVTSEAAASNVNEPWMVGVGAAINSDNNVEAQVEVNYGAVEVDIKAREAIYDVITRGHRHKLVVEEGQNIEWEASAFVSAFVIKNGWHGPYVNYVSRADGNDTYAAGWKVVIGN
jgi:hypothetical protein